MVFWNVGSSGCSGDRLHLGKVLAEGRFERGVEIQHADLAERRGFERAGPSVQDPDFSSGGHAGTVQKSPSAARHPDG